jgi:phosphoglycolate phosphatase
MSRALFFDLDGTLTDPKPGITRCVQYALERLGCPVPSEDELVWCIGPPLHESFAGLVGEDRAWRGVELYRERYADLGLYENSVYTGIDDVLRRLRAAGATLYVASSKPRVFVRQVLDHFDLSSHFDGVFGSELDGTRTDKTELLAYALDRSGARPEQATMIGDRSHDARGARNNAMAFLGVLYGYGSVEELVGAGATDWVEEPVDLVSALLGSPGG